MQAIPDSVYSQYQAWLRESTPRFFVLYEGTVSWVNHGRAVRESVSDETPLEMKYKEWESASGAKLLE